MKRNNVYRVASTLLVLILTFALSACSSREIDTTALTAALNDAASKIDRDFHNIRQEIVSLAGKIEELYQPEKVQEALHNAERSKYLLTENGIMYKPVDDGKSTVFVSGYIPVTEDLKEIVYFTEPIEDDLKAVTEEFPGSVSRIITIVILTVGFIPSLMCFLNLNRK